MDGVPAVFLQTLGLIGAVEEFALKELHSDNSEDEHEEDVDDEDVKNVLQRVYNTVEHRLKCLHRHTQISKHNLFMYTYLHIYIFRRLQ